MELWDYDGATLFQTSFKLQQATVRDVSEEG